MPTISFSEGLDKRVSVQRQRERQPHHARLPQAQRSKPDAEIDLESAYIRARPRAHMASIVPALGMYLRNLRSTMVI